MKKKILQTIKDNPALQLIIATITIIVVLSIVIFISGGYDLPFGITNRGGGGTGSIVITTTSNLNAAWSNHPVFTGPTVLHKIAIGEYELGGQVAIYDTTGEPSIDSIVFFVTGSSAQVWDLDYKMDAGITVNTTDQNHVMLFYSPLE